MKEVDKRARIELALGGLSRMVAAANLSKRLPGEQMHMHYKRSDIVALTPGTPATAHITKALRAKDWIRSYVQRLVDAEILVRDDHPDFLDQEFYLVNDVEMIKEILADHDEYGLRLLRFLFPNEAGVPDEITEAQQPEDEEDEEAEDEEPEAEELETHDSPEASPPVTVIVTTDLQELLESQRRTERELKGVTDLCKSLVGLVARSHKDTIDVLDGLGELLKFVSREATGLTVSVQDLSAASKPDAQVLGVVAELRAKLRDLNAVEELALQVIKTLEEKNE